MTTYEQTPVTTEAQREMALAAQQRCTLRACERYRVISCIVRHEGNLSKACRELGIGRTTMHRKVAEYKLDVSAIRGSRKC